MDRTSITSVIFSRWKIRPDHPWPETYPDYIAFRQKESLSWFALIMNVSGKKLGLATNAEVDLLNLKCESDNVTRLQNAYPYEILPAWHMNKKHWISVVLDSELPESLILELLEKSLALTQKPTRRKKNPA